MFRTVKSACSLDCFDACGMVVTIESDSENAIESESENTSINVSSNINKTENIDEKVVKVTGDPDHPVTKGFICHKGRAHIDRMYSSDRILKPLKKIDGRFEEVSWEVATDLIVSKLKSSIEKSGTQSIIHIFDCGYSGISKSVDGMFFNHLGGISTSSPLGVCVGKQEM